MSGTLLAGAAPLLAAAAALLALAGLLGPGAPAAIRAAMGDISSLQLALAGLLTALSFALLAALERLHLKALGAPLPFRRAAVSALIGNAVANAVGTDALSGSAVRARLFGAWRLEPELGRGLAAESHRHAAFGAGWLAALALSFCGPALGWPLWAAAPAGIAGLVLAAALAVAVSREPSPAWGRSALSTADWAAGAGALFVLLPGPGWTYFPAFAVLYTLAHVAAGAVRIPGGLLAFEALMLGAAQLAWPQAALAEVAAALLLYRAVYYLAPLAAAGAGLALAAPPPGLAGVQSAAGAAVNALAPPVFGLLSFAIGLFLLLAAATPWGLPLPPPLVSQAVSGLAGALLMLIGAGLARRYAGAWRLAGPVYAAAALAALGEGEYAAAAGLAATLLALAPLQAAFDRPASLARMRLAPGWLLLAALGLAAFAWIGFLAYEARFFAPFAVAGGFALLVLVWQLARPGRPPLEPLDEPRRAEVLAAIAGGDRVRPAAWLALVGDKRLLFSESRRSFIQYGEAADFLIAMGEPVGLAGERRALLWAFLELADRYDKKPAFYAVGREAVAELAEFGLAAQKVGETALAPLAGFSLEGPARAKLRHALNKARRDGLSFRVLRGAEVAGALPQLERLSREWLAAHPGGEKAFSLGRFEPEYLKQLPLAVVERAGELIAFASLQPSPDGRELAVDLMRFGAAAPTGAMDYLFTELLAWARDQGFFELDLGMAPLAGIDAHPRAPMASKLSALAYAYGERLYGFEGLRAYKQKFQPNWEPVFLCIESRAAAPLALSAVAWLTQGGVAGLLPLGRRKGARQEAAPPVEV